MFNSHVFMLNQNFEINDVLHKKGLRQLPNLICVWSYFLTFVN